jgi:hypothetical protein
MLRYLLCKPELHFEYTRRDFRAKLHVQYCYFIGSSTGRHLKPINKYEVNERTNDFDDEVSCFRVCDR